MVDRVRSCSELTESTEGMVAQSEPATCAALESYLDAASDVQVGKDVGLHHSNVGRRKFRAASGEVEHAVDAFTGRQLLRMVRADAARGGRLLDHFVRDTSPLAPSGESAHALRCTREAIRRLMATTEDCYLASEDGDLTPSEAQCIAARLRVLAIAASAWLPHLDARAGEKAER